MRFELRRLENLYLELTGLEFNATSGTDQDGQQWYLLQPRGHLLEHTFGIRTTLGWRRLRVSFEPGKFARDLLSEMSATDDSGRAVFRTVIEECVRLGAKLDFQVNDSKYGPDSRNVWNTSWNRLVLSFSVREMELGRRDDESDRNIVIRWTRRFATALVGILPLQGEEPFGGKGKVGFEEGASTLVQVNRYERDPRNRAAAILLRGSSCRVCGLDLGVRYGQIAEGFIEVHHIKPVSQLGRDYIIDPMKDLVPICPNCHAVVHRRDPPLSVDELRKILDKQKSRLSPS